VSSFALTLSCSHGLCCSSKSALHVGAENGEAAKRTEGVGFFIWARPGRGGTGFERCSAESSHAGTNCTRAQGIRAPQTRAGQHEGGNNISPLAGMGLPSAGVSMFSQSATGALSFWQDIQDKSWSVPQGVCVWSSRLLLTWVAAFFTRAVDPRARHVLHVPLQD